MTSQHGTSTELRTRRLGEKLWPAKWKSLPLAVAFAVAAGAAMVLIDGSSARADPAAPRTTNAAAQGSSRATNSHALQGFDRVILENIAAMTDEGRQTFRFDTFGDEAFWGDQLQLHRAIEGARFGGVDPGITPNAAIALGLKVDVEALPGNVRGDLQEAT